ncbi:MAG: aspartate--tRNA(Asn) ligase [Candidatus Dormiibacterota bacterium]
MSRVWSDRLGQAVGQRVQLAGWLHHQRRLSQVTFVLLRDGRGMSQVVAEDGALRMELAGWPPETVLLVEGLVVEAPQAIQGAELHDPRFTVVAMPEEPLPFELRRPHLGVQLPTLLDHAALGWRHPRQRALGRLAAAAVWGFRTSLDDRGFVEVQTPKLVASATEGGANVFPVDYFGRPAFLAQSPQFYKQTMVGVYERVYETAPVFRAEPHDTARHLAEYFSLDAEMGFITDHRDVMALLSEVMAAIFQAVADRAPLAVELLDISLPDLSSEVPRIHFRDAQLLLERETGEAVLGEPDLAPAHERFLGEWAEREYQSELLFVVGYPMAKRPFYTHPGPEHPEFSNSFDLLFRGQELVTGGQRLHRYRDYLKALERQDTAPYQGYLQAFRYGMPPHGGFAIGLERLVARLARVANVRQVTLFPRDLNRLEP